MWCKGLDDDHFGRLLLKIFFERLRIDDSHVSGASQSDEHVFECEVFEGRVLPSLLVLDEVLGSTRGSTIAESLRKNNYPGIICIVSADEVQCKFADIFIQKEALLHDSSLNMIRHGLSCRRVHVLPSSLAVRIANLEQLTILLADRLKEVELENEDLKEKNESLLLEMDKIISPPRQDNDECR